MPTQVSVMVAGDHPVEVISDANPDDPPAKVRPGQTVTFTLDDLDHQVHVQQAPDE